MPETERRALPAAASDITPAWLTAVLRDADAVGPSARVASVRPAPVEVGGVNGEVYRLTLAYERGEGPPTLIAKFPAISEAGRGVAAYQRWYEREVRSYRELAEVGVTSMPRCYLAELDSTGGFLLVLEDLGAQRQGNQLAGCSPEEAETAVRTVARLHARWWAHPTLETHEWLPLTTVGLERARPVQGALARAWEIVAGSYDLPGGLDDIAPRLVDRYPALLERAAKPPLTAVHGDYRLDNLFLAGDPPAVTAIDWQFACRCRGAYDIAYFVGLDLPPEQRRRLEPALLDAYLDALCAGGVQDYRHEELRHDYTLCLLLAFATFVIGAAGPQASERMRDVHATGLERLGTAIVDTDAASLLD